MTLLIILLIILMFFSGFFSGAEAALFSLPTMRVKSYQSDPNPYKRLIATLISRPRDLLVTVFMLNTLVNILIQNVAANIFGDYSSWTEKVGIPLVLTLIFGEIIPKYLGLQHNIIVSYYVAPTINFLQNILKPIRQATIAITAPISRLLFFYLKREPSISEDELQHILKTSEQHGVFNADEGELVAGFLKLQSETVKDIMWPREDIIYYDIHDPLTKLTHLFVEQKCSRLPVCDKDLDHVLGIITAKRFLQNREKLQLPQDIFQISEKPFYVPETTPARLLLRRFYEHHQMLALIVDEYGTISGLVTREDLIEVVVGEISDLRDQKSFYTRSGKNEIIASGKLELEEFNEIFHVQLKSQGNMVTIGGWLIEQLGEIPKSGSKYTLNHFLFQILAATPNRIRRLYVRKLSSNKNKDL